MSDHAGSFDRILASLHEVALDYSRWPAAARLIDEALDTRGICCHLNRLEKSGH